MADFLSELKRTFGQSGSAEADKINREIHAAFGELGEAFYNNNFKEGTAPVGYEEPFARLNQLHAQLEDLEKKIAEDSGQVQCSVCGNVMDREDLFCCICGARRPADPIESAGIYADASSAAVVKICPACRTKNEMDDRFCENCGRSLSDVTVSEPESKPLSLPELAIEPELLVPEEPVIEVEPESEPELLPPLKSTTDPEAESEPELITPPEPITSPEPMTESESIPESVAQPEPVGTPVSSTGSRLKIAPELTGGDVLTDDSMPYDIHRQEFAPVQEETPTSDGNKTCPECGQVLPGDSVFCFMCGAKIE